MSTEFLEFLTGPIEQLETHQRLRPTPVIMIGPAPSGTLSGVMEVLSHWGEGFQWNNNGVIATLPAPRPARAVGSDNLLGRPVEVIEYADGTIWLDTASLVILKHVSEHFTVEVTRYEEHPAIPQGFFSQQPARGATVRQLILGSPVAPQPFVPTIVVSGLPATTPSFPLPNPANAFGVNASGRFRATYLPDGYGIREGFGADSPGSAYGEWVARPLDSDGNPVRDGDYLRIGQRPMDARPAVLTGGEPFAVRGGSGFRTNTIDMMTLSWMEAGLAVQVQATLAVGFDELVRVAEGLVLNP